MKDQENRKQNDINKEGEVKHQVIPAHVVRETPPVHLQDEDDEKSDGIHVTNVEGTSEEDESREGIDFDRDTGPRPGDADGSRMTI